MFHNFCILVMKTCNDLEEIAFTVRSAIVIRDDRSYWGVGSYVA